jgi:Domain of unknown function (DUF4351)
MTRTPFDSFSKQLLEELLAPLGIVQVNREVPGESQFVDVFFVPTAPPPAVLDLGLLSQITATPCLIEPFRNPVTLDEIHGCYKKLISIREESIRQAKRESLPRSHVQVPELWILTPTLSKKTLAMFGAVPHEAGVAGLYRFVEGLSTVLVVIHQLPDIPETLWLRVLGRGRVQREAINEVLALPLQDRRRVEMLRLLASLKISIEMTPEIIDADQELMMALSQAYLEWEQATEQRGIQKGREEGRQVEARSLILKLLTRKFGELSAEARSQIEMLSCPQLETLGEALLDFKTPNDLITWLQEPRS